MLRGALKNVRDGLLALCYPQACRVCGLMVEARDDGVACAGCWNDTSITRLFDEPMCFKCGAPLVHFVSAMKAPSPAESHHVFDSQPSTREQVSCSKCASLPFSAARACGVYSGALEASLLFLKSHPHICRRLREIILRTFLTHAEALASDMVVPVPLHPQRERERGFNQARLIARVISKGFELPMDDRAVVRVKHTDMHRVGMDAVDRAKSVERAFKIKRPQLLNEKRVLLVDDVYTTGSTINAVSAALLEAGAHSVSVLTVARVSNI